MIFYFLQEALKAKQNELQRQKDALQRQMDMHHEQTMTRSPSHNAQHDPDYKNDGKTAPPSSVPQTVWDHVAHKRSASDELQRGIEEPVQLLSTEQAMSLKEPLHLNHQNQTAYSGSSVGNISAFVSGHDVSGNHLEGKSPIHLAMSVTNERRQQQTTLKPTQSASVSGPGAMGIKRNASYAATSSSGTSVQQMLPYHLSGKDRSSHTTSNPSIASANQSPDHHGMSRHSSASSVRAESPDRLQNQHPSTKITRSNTQITNKQSVKQQLSLQNQRSSHSSSMLPMQLAEKEKKRPRSASANLGNSGTQQRNASSLPSSRTSSVSAQDRVLLHYYKPGLKVNNDNDSECFILTYEVIKQPMCNTMIKLILRSEENYNMTYYIAGMQLLKLLIEIYFNIPKPAYKYLNVVDILALLHRVFKVGTHTIITIPVFIIIAS